MTGPLWLLLRPHPRHLKVGSQQKRVWKSTFTAARGPGVSLMQWELLDFPSCPPQDLESRVLFVECGRTLRSPGEVGSVPILWLRAARDLSRSEPT